MAGFLELIDNALGTHFNAPVYKPEKGRAKLVKVIDKAAAQRAAGETPPTRSWKTGSNGAVSFSPKIDGKPVLIGGEAVNYVPGDRFDTFLEGLKAAVQAGDLDDEIKAALEGDEAGSAFSAPKAARNVSGSSGERGARSPMSNLRSSVGRSLSNGRSLEEIEAALKAGSKFSSEDIDAVIAEKRAAS